MATAVSSAVVALEAIATGASFTGVTVMLMVAAAELTVPSWTVKVNASLPK